MAPALVQMLDPTSLVGMRTPVRIMLGDADEVAPPATNGLVAAKAIPGAELLRLPGVGHYDFLANCTDSGLGYSAAVQDHQSPAAGHASSSDRSGAGIFC
jgi:pimeloyl-ACP methyl ester carboxylesterase